MRPNLRHHFGGRMRRVLQRVIRLVHPPLFHGANFSADRDHRINEAINLSLWLAFGWFHHQCTGHGPGHGGGVKTVILQALGDIFHQHATALLEAAAIQDAFMRDHAIRTFVEHREMPIQTLGHVIGGKNRDLGRATQSLRPHHANIGVGNRQDGG